MPKVKPFCGIRPPKDLVEKVESRPYDVLDSEEARAEAGNNEMSLYHIIKPEINFPEGTSEYDERVYASGAEQFRKFQENGWLVRDKEENYYLYAQAMNDAQGQLKWQYGIVLCAHVDDYMNGVIKKHELTRRDKEDDRMRHVRETNANVEPVFLAFRHNPVLLELIERVAATEPVYDFVAPVDGFSHKFWVISDAADKATITEAFDKMDALYIADGHHRSAAAARVGAEKAAGPDAESSFYMAVCFPAEQLTILDYNRVVKDLNGLSSEEFLQRLAENFDVEDRGTEIWHPAHAHQFSLYLDGRWYSLDAKAGTFDPNDPIGVLDVDISSRLILQDILEIGDLRSSQRIDFVGGLRGLGELKRRVDSGEMRAALALFPVSMDQVMNIADTGNIMPPKATWFEPKLRSGLVIHSLD
ncbi:MAG: DUF1015 domain-containing protein [Bacteroidales bacterium]|nr:DUF1015 domain-containing protein [Bacteroidales bacterium]